MSGIPPFRSFVKTLGITASVRDHSPAPHMRDMNPSDRNPYDPAVRSLAGNLLGYHRLPGGTMPSEFTYALFDLWAKADEVDKDGIATGWPFVAFVLRAHETDGQDGLRRIVQN